jgi:hypothetical protein
VPSTAAVGAGGGSFSVNVTATATCSRATINSVRAHDELREHDPGGEPWLRGRDGGERQRRNLRSAVQHAVSFPRGGDECGRDDTRGGSDVHQFIGLVLPVTFELGSRTSPSSVQGELAESAP